MAMTTLPTDGRMHGVLSSLFSGHRQGRDGRVIYSLFFSDERMLFLLYNFFEQNFFSINK